MIVLQPKLFQAGPAYCELAQRTTGCHSYNVWAYKTKFVVCMNTWHEGVQELSEGDKDWLLHNVVLLEVNEPMYHE